MKRSLVEQVQFIIHMKGCTEDIWFSAELQSICSCFGVFGSVEA